MKFRISSKDLIIFIVFCIFLLYLCGIGVMNFITFGAEGRMWGLNPIPAFQGSYLPITLILFIIALIMIFSSVSSYIFEHLKGKGVGIDVRDKEEKGYSNWAKDKEIKNDIGVKKINYTSNKIEAAGIPLISNKKRKEMWVDDGEYHTVVIGSSGSGKSQCIVKPLVNLLSKNGESMIITDPKGELYVSAAEHLKQLGYNVVVLNFRDPLRGNAWNPLTLPYQYMKMGNMDKATELLDDVALNILYDPNNKGEPFWEKTSADFFSGLALGLFEDAKEEETNINSISVMSTVGEERLGPSNYLKEYFTMKGEASSAYTFASSTINAPSDTKGGIMSTFRQKIRLFASRENLSEMLGHSDFNMLDIGKQKTAVFIVIHDEKTTYHALATIFIKQCYETLIDVAQENKGKLPIRTNFILDEFANMPPLKDVDSMVTAARSRKMRFTFIIQNFAQLNDVYGKEVAEVIRGNCGNTIYLISSELAALEEISKMCGEVKSKEKDKTASTPLVTVTDLQKFKMGEALLIRTRKGPFKTKLLFDYQTDWGYERKDADFPQRESKPIEIFDIREYVKNKKKEKDMANGGLNGNMMNPSFNGGFNPFGPQSNPFGGEQLQQPMSSPFGMGANIDLDAMMRDIDKKIAELDAEEAKQNIKDIDPYEASSKALAEIENSINKEPIESKTIASDEIKLPKELDKKINDFINNSNFNDEEIEPPKIKEAIVEEKLEIPREIEIKEEEKVNKLPDLEPLPEIEAIGKEKDYLNDDTFFEEPSKQGKFIQPISEEIIPTSIVNETYVEHPNSYTNANNVINSEEKPKVNVDIDSVVVNNNLISDDEFFDDFFGDE